MTEALKRARWVLPAGAWPAHREAGTITLGWDDRHRRRIRLVLDRTGEAMLLDLARAARLGEGDGLLFDDGAIVRVIAAPEPVLEIRAGSASLPQLAYHLGNRHLPVEIRPDVLVIRSDAVIAEMVRVLGGHATAAMRPFTPEGGAYGGGHGHGEDHDHGDGHHHPHAH
jgi:urease accessory protein